MSKQWRARFLRISWRWMRAAKPGACGADTLEVQSQVELKRDGCRRRRMKIVVVPVCFRKTMEKKRFRFRMKIEEMADLFAYDDVYNRQHSRCFYYINYQRGSTTLGTRAGFGFVYMLRMDLIRIIIRKFLSGSIRMTGFTVTFTKKKSEGSRPGQEPIAEQGGAEPLRQPESRCAAEGGRCAEGAAGSDGGCAYHVWKRQSRS